MFNNLLTNFNTYYQEHIVSYMNELYKYPIKLIPMILDVAIVIFLLYKFFKFSKDSRVRQLLKGIFLYIILTALSSILQLTIINYILTSFLSYGVIALIVIFQPELRRALEQLGSNKFTKFIGIEKDKYVQTKEDIYKIVIAVGELARSKTGALIVLEKDIKITEIIESGIMINSEISPQLLVNIFVPNTPLHDGAVVIRGNRITAGACILPLASDQDIAKELGTRHRAALGISKESDSVAIVVSEETGKVSLARNGVLLVDIKEETLKQILIKDFAEKYNSKSNGVKKITQKIKSKKNENERSNEMRNIKLTIEYDGKDFNGWQKQKSKLNIQGEIERAISAITGEEDIDLIASGRTDAGVHALGQIANFKTNNTSIPIEKFALAINTKLKKSIRILKAEEVDERFHSRYTCKKKTYRYVINNNVCESAIYRNFEYHLPLKLNIDDMQKAIKYFEGEHDFKAFKASGTSSKSSVRKIYKAEVKKADEGRIWIELTGSGFLYNMVRIIAGTLVDVGIGKINPDDIPAIIESKNRQNAGKTLPPNGLFLVKVEY